VSTKRMGLNKGVVQGKDLLSIIWWQQTIKNRSGHKKEEGSVSSVKKGDHGITEKKKGGENKKKSVTLAITSKKGEREGFDGAKLRNLSALGAASACAGVAAVQKKSKPLRRKISRRGPNGHRQVTPIEWGGAELWDVNEGMFHLN